MELSLCGEQLRAGMSYGEACAAFDAQRVAAHEFAQRVRVHGWEVPRVESRSGGLLSAGEEQGAGIRRGCMEGACWASNPVAVDAGDEAVVHRARLHDPHTCCIERLF